MMIDENLEPFNQTVRYFLWLTCFCFCWYIIRCKPTRYNNSALTVCMFLFICIITRVFNTGIMYKSKYEYQFDRNEREWNINSAKQLIVDIINHLSKIYETWLHNTYWLYLLEHIIQHFNINDIDTGNHLTQYAKAKLFKYQNSKD